MIKKLIKESVLEVGYAIYMSEVYKIPMVRMIERSDETANAGVYIHSA